ncbi:FAD-dependent monooxygenase [Sphaerisporangium sp. TRM90804]|uniref:FAD-dependent monooxygenase n=1 Tax=Sphaerisporangium sp. TRM90804 TaxID=3031113 RepID=UPI00244A8CA0|nr:FAD-dependent monooxygenase [Sphaerisporangium sp. TRM90804]MDH2427446.1 FAD-dependent monooxygenase [Sphaerisporangium sp. TRM90804]
MSHAVVIGSGIGGLTAAAALTRQGWSVTVCERAESLERVGAGIAIAPNALKALDTIGAGDEVRELAALQGEAGLRRAGGRWMLRSTAEAAAARFGDPTVLLLRTILVDVLARRVAPESLRLGTTVHGVDAATGRVTTSAGELEADLVVAADGIHSAVRRSLFPAHPGPAPAGVTSWRIVVPRPKGEIRGGETWGRGKVFGVMPLVNDQVYCYATAPMNPRHGDGGGRREELLRLFRGWHDPIPSLIEAAREEEVLQHDIYWLSPLPALHTGRVALLGDAAHVMTPNLGQGACQAIEDAVVLAHVAGRAGGTPDLAAYTSARLPRTTKIMERSRALCRLTLWSNPLAVAARDAAVSLAGRLGESAGLRSFDEVFTWRPPAS